MRGRCRRGVPRGGRRRDRRQRRLKFENSALAYQAAIDEVGIVVAQRAFVEDDLRAGRLVEVFDLRASTGNAYYLAYPAQEHASAKIRAFEDWIVGEAARLEEVVR